MVLITEDGRRGAGAGMLADASGLAWVGTVAVQNERLIPMFGMPAARRLPTQVPKFGIEQPNYRRRPGLRWSQMAQKISTTSRHGNPPVVLPGLGVAVGFRPEFLDFERGIHVGNLEENQRITRILKLALEARYGQPFVTERWGRGVYWQWIG